MESDDRGVFARSWRLTKAAWFLARTERSVLAVAGLGGIAGLVLTAAIAFVAGGWDVAARVAFVTWPFAFVTTFSGVALATAAAAALDGLPDPPRAAFGAAAQRLPQIASWSLLAAAVAVAINVAVVRIPGAGHVLAIVADVAWALVVFFAIPILAAEGPGPLATARRARQLIRSRWAESVTGMVAIAVWTVVLLIPGVLVVAFGAGGSNDGGGAHAIDVVAIVAGVVLLVAAIVLGQATSQVFAVAVYRSAETVNRR